MRQLPVTSEAFVLVVLSVLLAGCGNGALGDTTGAATGDAALDVPTGPEDASGVVVRVSGSEGIPFRGFFGTVGEEEDLKGVEDTIGSEPTDYEVEVPEEAMPSPNVFVEFEKTEPGQGELKVQILGDGKVVEEARTLSRLGRVGSEWESGDMQVGSPPGGEMVPPEIESTEAVLFEQGEFGTEVPPKSSP